MNYANAKFDDVVRAKRYNAAASDTAVVAPAVDAVAPIVSAPKPIATVAPVADMAAPAKPILAPAVDAAPKPIVELAPALPSTPSTTLPIARPVNVFTPRTAQPVILLAETPIYTTNVPRTGIFDTAFPSASSGGSGDSGSGDSGEASRGSGGGGGGGGSEGPADAAAANIKKTSKHIGLWLGLATALGIGYYYSQK